MELLELPTTTAQVAVLLQANHVGAAIQQKLLADRAAAKNEYSAAFGAPKNGPFRKTGAESSR